MSPLPRKRTAARLPEQRTYRRVGAVRRAQLITTYGVGSLVAVENGSFIIGGLEDWKYDDGPAAKNSTIQEPRLARALGVDDFRLPPAPPDDTHDGIKVHRFPTLYSCKKCSLLAPFKEFNSPKNKSICAECDEELTPSRFIAACENGHAREFPYREWVHRVEKGRSDSCSGKLSMRTRGTTASLRSIIISCECGREASMEGSFRSNALTNLKIKCYGERPWLGENDDVECTEPLRTLQRGSSAAWFPVVRSAISIPPWTEGLHYIIGPYLNRLSGCTDAEIAVFLKVLTVLEGTSYTPDDVIQLVREIERDAEADEGDSGAVWSKLLEEEYRKLRSRTPEVDRDQQFVCEKPVGDTTPVEQLGISKTMLVNRLREVRAIQAFTRISALDEEDDKSRLAPLSRTKSSWLPAIEVIGEGVFIDLTGDRLAKWEIDVLKRTNIIRTNHLADIRERTGAAPEHSFVTPRYVLLHTLAHILINEWSLDAGYPAASLRERLYIGDDMAGILIYTATSDSAGSLGGVVAQGEPDRLVGSLEAALERSRWCSADPLCMESGSIAAGTLNLAACHCCVMLPETSCETNNRFLDRAVLLGTPEEPDIGYFAAAWS